MRWIVIAFLAVAWLVVFTVTASGQQPKYEQLNLPDAFNDKNVVKRMEIAARTYAGSGSVDERSAAMARYYFETYVPARMTQPSALPELSDMVKNVTKLLTQSQRMSSPNARSILAAVYKGMKKVAEGNYYPPAKINALLVLGRLDERSADPIAKTPPVPLSYSLPILLAQYNNPANVDGVRAAALHGLHRYVSFRFGALSPEDKATLQTAMTDLLAAPAPAARSDDAHAYLQRYAVDMLDLLRPQDDPGLGVQLIGISTQAKKPNLIALHSMARLGRMSKELQGKVDKPDVLLESWSARALKAFQAELDRLAALDRTKQTMIKQPPRPEEFLENKRAETSKSTATGMGGMQEGMYEMEMDDMDMGGDEMEMEMMDMSMGYESMMGSGYGRPTAKPQPPEIIASRRQLNHVLQLIHVGVTGSPAAGLPKNNGGVLAMVSAEQKPEVEAWVTAMQPIVEAINDEMLDTRVKYVEAVTAQIEALEELAGSEAEAAEEENIDDLLAAPGPLGVVNQVAPVAPVAAGNGGVAE